MNATVDKPLLSVLNGRHAVVPPIWLMRQAGRYLPEYRELRAKAGSFLDLCFNPELAAEVTLQPIRRFGFDAAILFADILLVPLGLGQKVWFEEGEGPRLEPIASSNALSKLSAGKVVERTASVFETVARVRQALDPRTAVIGFAGAPWTVATYMIAGRGTPDQAEAKLLAYRDPSFVAALTELLVEATIPYLKAQVDAGAEVLQLFDTWAGGLSPALHETLVFKPTAKIVAALKRDYPRLPIIGFPRGLGAALGNYARATGVDAVSIATGDDLDVLNPLLPKELTVQGGLDPLALIAGGAALEEGVKRLLRAMTGRPYIFNLGHGIMPQTPPEHVARLVELVRGAAR